MKKNQLFITLFITISYLTWNYYTYESSRKKREAFLSDLNISVINMREYLATKSIKTDVNYSFWDLKKSDIVLKREKKLALLKKDNNKKIDNKDKLNLKKRVICLKGNCWEFMGIVVINNVPKVTLLSKDKKLKTFQVNDMLLEGVKIIKIRGDELVVEEIKEKKRFSLKLFEINVKKYLPKEHIKEKNDSKI